MSEQSKRVPFWRSLQTKFALTYVVIIAAVLILLNTYPVLVSQDLVYQSKQASLQNQAAVLASALSMGPEELPFNVIAAGQPNLPGVLTKSRSYAERLFQYKRIGRLPEDETRECFEKTIGKINVRFDDDALNRLIELSKGYPYFIQAYGSAAFDESESSPIPLSAVIKGEPIAQASLDSGLYESRWQRARPLEREYMRAMASLEKSVCSCPMLCCSPMMVPIRSLDITWNSSMNRNRPDPSFLSSRHSSSTIISSRSESLDMPLSSLPSPIDVLINPSSRETSLTCLRESSIFCRSVPLLSRSIALEMPSKRSS